MNNKDITCLVISAILFLFSIQYHRGKWYGSLAGYNTMPKDEREYIDIRPYVQRTSMVCFSMGLLFWPSLSSGGCGKLIPSSLMLSYVFPAYSQ